MPPGAKAKAKKKKYKRAIGTNKPGTTKRLFRVRRSKSRKKRG